MNNDTLTVIAMKHGLECKVKEEDSLGAAISFATRYHLRTGIAVKVYDNKAEMVWSLDDYEQNPT